MLTEGQQRRVDELDPAAAERMTRMYEALNDYRAKQKEAKDAEHEQGAAQFHGGDSPRPEVRPEGRRPAKRRKGLQRRRQGGEPEAASAARQAEVLTCPEHGGELRKTSLWRGTYVCDKCLTEAPLTGQHQALRQYFTASAEQLAATFRQSPELLTAGQPLSPTMVLLFQRFMRSYEIWKRSLG